LVDCIVGGSTDSLLGMRGRIFNGTRFEVHCFNALVGRQQAFVSQDNSGVEKRATRLAAELELTESKLSKCSVEYVTIKNDFDYKL
jgi:hypothetical protein